MAADNRPKFNILLVEDNSGDVMLMREVLSGSRFLSNIEVVTDGLEAIEYLRHKDKHCNASMPDLIIMDLTLPRMGGHDALKEIKSDPVLRAIPIVIFTGSDAPEDIRKAYSSYANCYITKPIGLDQLEKKLMMIEEFWFGTAKIPSKMNMIEINR
jgi:chemotaxis family two-component system response regulator Rcp1